MPDLQLDSIEIAQLTPGETSDVLTTRVDAEVEAVTEALDGVVGGAIPDGTYTIGRTVSHPPEPPHFIEIWFYKDYDALKYAGQNPYGEVDAAAPFLSTQGLTIPQVLHVGRLENELPMVGYAPWENHVFFFIGCVALIAIVWFFTRGFRRPKEEVLKRPTRSQAMVESIVDGFDNLCRGVLGEQHGRTYLPFITTMFFLILLMNLMGIVPFMRAPTASIVVTGALAMATFFVYMYTGITKLGPLVFAHHMLGSPQSAVQWVLSPLFLFLELISYLFAKPASLALRLFGNILGKDILMGSFLLMGISLVAAVSPGAANYFGLPLTLPFYFLGILLATIQALVFSLLSMIYILLLLPHDHDHEHDDHGHGHEGHAEAHA